MRVSFVIPAHDEADYIAPTIDALIECGQALRDDYEIIVADDASTDDTASIAEARGARVVRTDVRQIAGARNAGARAAAHELLIFVDADTLVPFSAVQGAVQAVEAGAVGGGAGFHFDDPVPKWVRRVEPFLRWLYRRIRFASGSFLFCTRDAFHAVGGFDERYYAAEEAIMSRALRKYGRFVVLPQRVITSSRKIRAYRKRELFAPLLRQALKGPWAGRSRQGLDIWYAPRRPDPAHDATRRAEP